MFKSFLSVAATTLLLASSPYALAGNCSDGQYQKTYSSSKQKHYSSADIVDTALAAGSFKTLATALQAADLVNTLKGKGPFTVLAPTDQAFAKIPPAQLNALLADPAALKKILLYHVIPGRVPASMVTQLNSAKTAAGLEVKISAGKGVRVNNANVTQTDIKAKNGIIHVIDTVLLPPM